MTDEVAGFANRFLFGHEDMTELFSIAYWRSGGSYVLERALESYSCLIQGYKV